MKNKKGFTLIELLAIIVILAIIAVITVPIILNVIENSKRGAATDSAYGYKDAIDKFYVAKLSIDSGYNIPDGLHTKQDFDNMGVTYSGKSPADNSFLKTQKNRITQGCLQFDEYKVEVVDGKPQQATKGTCKTVDIMYVDVNTNEKIDLGDTVKIEGEDFYIIDEPSNGKVKLITKYSLDSNSRQSSSNYMTGKFVDDAQQAYWAYSAGAGRYMEPEYINKNGYVYTRDNNNYLYSYFENYRAHLIEIGATFVTDVRAMSYDEARKTGCVKWPNEGYQDSCPSYLSADYWLGTASDGRIMYAISSNRYIEDRWSDTTASYRPLVEINESALTNEYTIKYDSRGGTEITDQKVVVGSNIGTFPPTPSKTNSEFVGWYTDAEYTSQATTETIPVGSATYYAKWNLSKAEYTDSNNNGQIDLGDYVKIIDDEFYVISSPSNGKVKLITKYNLDSNSRQSSSNYMTGKFVDDAQQAYWAYSAGAGRYIEQEYIDKNYYVYEEPSNLHPYFSNYKTYLNTQGAAFVTDVRALSYEDATGAGCIKFNETNYQNSCPPYMTGAYWLGTANDGRIIYSVTSGGYIDLTWPDTTNPIAYRPLVEINVSAIPTN